VKAGTSLKNYSRFVVVPIHVHYAVDSTTQGAEGAEGAEKQ